MMRARSLMVALAVLALVPMPLLAQGGGMGRGGAGGPGGAMVAARALAEQGSVEFLVTKAADLELTAEQKTKLEAIGAAWSESTKQSRERVRAVMPQPGQAMGGRGGAGGGAGGGDRQATMQRIRDLQPVMQKLQEDDQKSLDEALELLSEPQQAKAKQLLEERQASMRPRG
jgi:hypothetical protein